MHPTHRYLAVPLIVLLAWPSSALAQARHAVDPAALGAAVAQHVAAADADRDAVLDVLSRPEVRDTAARLGVDLAPVRNAVPTLGGDDLARAAAAARQLDQSLAGGASSVTLSTTTIIIGLLVIILLVVALK